MDALTQEQIDAEASRRLEIAAAILLSLSLGLTQSQINLVLDNTAASRLEIGGFAEAIANISAADQVQVVIDSLAQALLGGMSFESWKVLATSGRVDLGMPPAQLATAIRTNVQTAYNAGRYSAQVANKFNQPVWMYDAVNDSRTRETHAEMSGFLAAADDPVWSVWYPPNGYNCRCSIRSMTVSEAAARGYVPGTAPPNVQPDPGFGFNAAAPGGLNTVSHAALSSRHLSLSPGVLSTLTGL